MKLKDRKNIVRKMPKEWVYEIGPVGQIPCKVLVGRSKKSRRNCKHKAKWHYTFTWRSKQYWGLTDMDVCWMHLIYACFYRNPDEEARVRKWMERHGY